MKPKRTFKFKHKTMLVIIKVKAYDKCGAILMLNSLEIDVNDFKLKNNYE